MNNEDWKKRFEEWWRERFGDGYVGTYPQGEFYDFISEELARVRKETIEEDYIIEEQEKSR